MTKSGCRIGCAIFFAILALICLVSGLFMLIGFGKVYKAAIDDQIVIHDEEDGQLTKAGFWLMHPPVNALSEYFIFEVNNTEEIEFYGGKPKVNEIGPFVIRATQNKWNYSFMDDEKILRYKSYITFNYEHDLSCDGCEYDRIVTVPNLIGIGTIEELLDPLYNISSTEVFLFDLIILLLGEYPFIHVSFGQLLFNGYEDALLSVAHSPFFDDLTALNGGKPIVPIPIPDMTRMAFFYNYNNTNDEIYEVYTGKDDISKAGKIKKWANEKLLPEVWWADKVSREIRGSESGGTQHPNLGNDKPISLYQSYMCRSFDVEYSREEKYKDIDVYRFEGGVDNFDTTLSNQLGFRYLNREQVDYYPNWPSCQTSFNNTTKCERSNIDCSLKDNICTECCSSEKVKKTGQLPPGMYPVNCYPGRVKVPPFHVLFTIPHFNKLPPEVISSIDGMRNLGEKGVPFMFKYVPRTGVCVEANIRFQIAIPMYKTSASIMISNFPNKILPFLWVDNSIRVKDNVYDKLYLGFVLLPKLALALKIILPILFVIFSAFSALLIFYRRSHVKIVKTSESEPFTS